jgi:hypothetical protein
MSTTKSEEVVYRDLKHNNSFVGRWIYTGNDQVLKLLVTRKNRVKVKKETTVDVFQVRYDYTKQERVQAENIGTEKFSFTYETGSSNLLNMPHTIWWAMGLLECIINGGRLRISLLLLGRSI